MTSIDNKMVSYDEVKCFDHTWELGMRKAKELLFTDDAIDVAKEHRIGRINQIVPRDEREKLVLRWWATSPLSNRSHESWPSSQ